MSVTIKFVDPDGDDIDPAFFRIGLQFPLRLLDVVFEKTWWGLGRRATFTFMNTLTDLEGQPGAEAPSVTRVARQLARDYTSTSRRNPFHRV